MELKPFMRVEPVNLRFFGGIAGYYRWLSGVSQNAQSHADARGPHPTRKHIRAVSGAYQKVAVRPCAAARPTCPAERSEFRNDINHDPANTGKWHLARRGKNLNYAKSL